MTEEIKRYKGRYTGPQIDDLLGRVPTVEERLAVLEQGGGDKNKVINVEVASDVWEIEHNMGKFPAVSVVTSSNQEVIADVEYVNNNVLKIKLAFATSGKVILN